MINVSAEPASAPEVPDIEVQRALSLRVRGDTNTPGGYVWKATLIAQLGVVGSELKTEYAVEAYWNLRGDAGEIVERVVRLAISAEDAAILAAMR